MLVIMKGLKYLHEKVHFCLWFDPCILFSSGKLTQEFLRKQKLKLINYFV